MAACYTITGKYTVVLAMLCHTLAKLSQSFNYSVRLYLQEPLYKGVNLEK